MIVDESFSSHFTSTSTTDPSAVQATGGDWESDLWYEFNGIDLTERDQSVRTFKIERNLVCKRALLNDSLEYRSRSCDGERGETRRTGHGGIEKPTRVNIRVPCGNSTDRRRRENQPTLPLHPNA